MNARRRERPSRRKTGKGRAPKRQTAANAPDALARPRSHVVVGLPGSGKSSFLAAFWHAVDQGSGARHLELHRLCPDREYLNRLADDWVRLRELSRTPVHFRTAVELSLRDASTGTVFDAVFPDVSGEVFGTAWAERAWPAHLDRQLGAADGIVLFIHPDIDEPARIDDWLALADEVSDGPVPAGEAGNAAATGDGPTVRPFNPRKVPTAVVLADLLEMALGKMPAGGAPRVAVVISAWDLVRKQQLSQRVSPRQWLAARLPLLDQFLEARAGRVEARVFGVSALGGELANDRTQLAALDSPDQRVAVATESGESHDITAPIRWVLLGDQP